MKVAQACYLLGDYGGNFIRSLMSINAAATRSEVPMETIFILPEGRPDLEWIIELQRHYKVYFISVKSFFTMARDIYMICRKEKIDILHAHFFEQYALAFVGVFSRTKVVNHYHFCYKRSPNKLKQQIHLLTIRLAIDKFVGCSKASMDSIIEGGVPRKMCTYIANRIDFSRLDLSKNPQPFDADKNNFLIFGTLFHIKGCDLALKAIEPIAEKYNISLHIVSHNIDSLKADVKQTLGYEPQWVKYPLTTECIGDYYRNATVFLSPSREEGFCTSIDEAVYCGCPVIKSDIESMVHGLDGEDFIRVPLTVEALRDKIVEVLEMEPERRKAMTESFRKQVIEKFDISIWGEEVLQVYKDVLQ